MGADYKKMRQDFIRWFSNGAIPANTIIYYTLTQNGAEIVIQLVMAMGGFIRNLINAASGAPGAGETFTYTLRVNGINSALTAQTAGAVLLVSEDNVNAVRVERGDLVSIILVTSLNATVQHHKSSMVFVPD